MAAFNFEKNLSHQDAAVESTLAVFDNLSLHQFSDADKNKINPVYNRIDKIGVSLVNHYIPFDRYFNNIKERQIFNGISEPPIQNSNIIDIMMETGTGKTYTYTKTIFELNQKFNVYKFIIVVPTLSIKAGTIDFLNSESSREHFKEQYDRSLTLHIVESQKNNKSKKSFIPPAVSSFVNAGNFEKNSIQVLIINAGMLTSDTMKKSFDKGLFDKYTVPVQALAAVKPFLIIDEPHKFKQNNEAWKVIEEMIRPQFVLRYGATFPEKDVKHKSVLTGKMETTKVKDYHNLIYKLTAVDSFNRNLVKGIIGHITEFESGKNAVVKFVDSDGVEAIFELTENDRHRKFTLTKNESLQKIHSEMTDLSIENLNKSTVVLSNGLEMKKGDKINPFSFASTLQEIMIQKAIKHHFEIEKNLLTLDVRIKPLTLFFIDNIEEYREKEGSIRKIVEQYIELEINELLKFETDEFYRSYLEKTLADISLAHGGYFSKDNTEKDEAIEKEINEILHDKQAMLDLENPRRFIFSKWTLREGWDNPNVFQICKLRSSGSEISKLQEVGRGLRLPVNEYGNRVKDANFYLNYFVDFTESDFVDKLVTEINEKSGAVSFEKVETSITPLVKIMLQKYPEQFKDEEQLLEYLDDNQIIKRNNDFKEGGFDFVKKNFPLIFEGVNSGKVRKATDVKKKVVVRTSKYDELKEIWEKLNEKVILEYKFEDELEFKTHFTAFLKSQKNNFKIDGINERVSKIEIKDNQAIAKEPESVYGRKITSFSTMKYSDFLKELSKILNINIKTLHHSIIESEVEINKYLNQTTLRLIKQNFDHYLMANAIDKFTIEYKKVSNSIHPTKLTDAKGNVLKEINASDVGVLFSEEKVDENYFFEELFYDSDLEKQNIQKSLKEVIVFTKIPKNSIKIPVAGGKSYSPDFAYVLKFNDGEQKLNFIIETKDVNDENSLRNEEKFKIKHAEKFFDGKVNIAFKTQFSNNKIVDLINEIREKN
jgi:type III restriction enzyme